MEKEDKEGACGGEEETTGGGGDNSSSRSETGIEQPQSLHHHRPGSPAVSVASAVLEWDPSADVGSNNNISDQKSQHSSSRRNLNLLEGFSECDISEFGPNYELEGKPPSRPGSGRGRFKGDGGGGGDRAQKTQQQGYAYSTPSSTPVPLKSPQYSPVLPHSSYAATSGGASRSRGGSRRGSNDQLEMESKGEKQQNLLKSKSESSNSNEDNDDKSDLADGSGKHTPGRVVSGSSTDWEYDHDKHMASKSISQWQTSGLTKSEIEYETRKKNGSSTSIASSVLMLKVDTKLSTSDRASPEEDDKRNQKRRNNKDNQFTSSSADDYSSAQERKYRNMLSRYQYQNNIESKSKRSPKKSRDHHQQQRQTQNKDNEVSDPSSMCRLIKNCVQLWEDDSSKENVQYDVLKRHRDYHLMKIWKQISTVEKLNMQLLDLKKPRKRSPSKPSKRSSLHDARRSEHDIEYERYRNRSPRENKPKSLSKRNDLTEQVFAFFKERENAKQKHDKPRRKEFASDPSIAFPHSSKTPANIPIEIERKDRRSKNRGNSMPFLNPNHLNEVPLFKDPRRGSDPSTKSKKSINNLIEKLVKANSKSRECVSDPSANNRSREKDEMKTRGKSKRDRKYKRTEIGLSLPMLEELINQLVVPEVLMNLDLKSGKGKKKPDRNQVSNSKDVLYSESVDSSSESEDESTSESDSECSVVEFTGSKSNLRSKGLAEGSVAKGKKESSVSKSQEIQPKERKPPVGFYIPLNSDEEEENQNEVPSVSQREEESNNGQVENPSKFENCYEEWRAKGLFDIKKPKKIQDCLKERKPNCYQSIKDRDEFILHRKVDRQMREETLLKEILNSDIPFEDVEEYMSTYFRYCNSEQRKRAMDYLENYKDAKIYTDDGKRIISSREMRERTARFLHNDFVERQRKEALERKKQIIRDSQRNFSKNLRRYQQLGKVNVPDNLKLGRIK